MNLVLNKSFQIWYIKPQLLSSSSNRKAAKFHCSFLGYLVHVRWSLHLQGIFIYLVSFKNTQRTKILTAYHVQGSVQSSANNRKVKKVWFLFTREFMVVKTLNPNSDHITTVGCAYFDGKSGHLTTTTSDVSFLFSFPNVHPLWLCP